MSLLLSALVLSQMLVMVVDSQRGFVRSNAAVKAASSARHAHAALGRLLRVSGADPQDLEVVGIDPDPLGRGVFDNVRLRSDYNPPDGDITDPGEDVTFWLSADTLMVRWGPAALAEPYLIGVDSLAFEYFDWNGTPILNPSLVATSAVSVQVTVRGSSEAFGEPRDQLLSGRVTIRNR